MAGPVTIYDLKLTAGELAIVIAGLGALADGARRLTALAGALGENADAATAIGVALQRKLEVLLS